MYKITEEIYVGGITTAEEVKHNKIKCVIFLSNATTDYPGYNYQIFDSSGNDPKQFIKILEAIDKHIKAKDIPIFLNCGMGISRSPVIAALWLYHDNRFKSFDEALEFVHNRSKVTLKGVEAMPNPKLITFVKEKVIPLLNKTKKDN